MIVYQWLYLCSYSHVCGFFFFNGKRKHNVVQADQVSGCDASSTRVRADFIDRETGTKLVQREQLQPLNLRQILRKISSYPVLNLPTEVLQSFRSPVSSHKHLSLQCPSLSRSLSHTHTECNSFFSLPPAVPA